MKSGLCLLLNYGVWEVRDDIIIRGRSLISDTPGVTHQGRAGESVAGSGLSLCDV